MRLLPQMFGVEAQVGIRMKDLGNREPHCVWVAVVCSGFSFADRLPSAPSADGFPSLFGHFAGTSRSSDSPPTFLLDLWLIAFSNWPAYYFVSGIDGVSRFSRAEFPCMQGS